MMWMPETGRLARRVVVLATLLAWMAARPASGGERYAVVVTGAAGGGVYAQKYQTLRATFVTTLRETFGYPADHVFVLAEEASEGVQKATRENVQRAFADVRKRLTKDDQLLVFLVGHGTTTDGDEAKFNLVGPDLSAGD